MARVRVTVDGWERLVRRLNDLPDDVREGAENAIEESADAIRDQGRDQVRVDTGALRRGLKAYVRKSELSADVGWRDPDLYYAKFQEFGTSKITANPALTAATEAERRRFPDRISDDVRREMAR